MRIGILEWICGGGLHGTSPEQIPESLLNEGWAMLQAVLEDCASFGHEVTTTVDPRLFTQSQLTRLESRFQVSSKVDVTTVLPSSWWELKLFYRFER